MGVLPKIQSKGVLVEPIEPKKSQREDKKHVCERFLKRGNDPVASNYEEMELKPIKGNDLVIIPNADIA